MRRLIESERTFLRLAYILFVVYLILILCTFRDYGITWDEQWHANYGTHIIWWYTSLFHNRSAFDEMMDFYGGFFEVIAQTAARYSPLGLFETRHLISGLFGFVGVAYAFRLGQFIAGPLAGFLAALFLILTPRFYGHSFFNNKDIPFAVMYLVSVYYIIKSSESLPRISRRMMLTLGIVIGLCIGIRFNGIILFSYLLLAFVLWLLVQGISESEAVRTLTKFKTALTTFVPRCLFIVAIAYGTALIWWPAAQVDPIGKPMKVLTDTYNHGWTNKVFFDGASVPVAELPWYYIEKWFLITLPEFYFVALAVGGGLLGLAVVRGRNIFEHASFIWISVLLWSVLCPFAFALVTGIVLYDSERHFLFVIPPLAVLAAVSVGIFLTQARAGVLRFVVVVMIVWSFVGVGVEMWSLHPYEYIYFNRLFGGGLKEAAKSFETDYWGASYKEGVEWMVKNYRRTDGRKVKVASCSFPTSTGYYVPKERFEYLGSYEYGKEMTGHDPDLFLTTTRWVCGPRVNGHVVHVVERHGVPLLYIKEVAGSATLSQPH